MPTLVLLSGVVKWHITTRLVGFVPMASRTAQDVTADELRIESFFPADADTEALFRAAGGA